MNHCKPEQRADGLFFCPVCDFVGGPRPFVRNCGPEPTTTTIVEHDPAPHVYKLHARPCLQLPTTRERIANHKPRPGERSADECLALFEICRQCPEFKGSRCGRDRGCDAASIFLLRIRCRWCDRWPAPYDKRPTTCVGGSCHNTGRLT